MVLRLLQVLRQPAKSPKWAFCAEEATSEVSVQADLLELAWTVMRTWSSGC